MISESNPLQRFFYELVERNYEEVGVRNSEVQAYVANLLAEFCDSENLYKIRDQAGLPIYDVGAMLLAADPVYGPAPSFDRERQVRKHIGDYSLFFTGMLPEALNHLRLRNARLEGLVDFIRAGKAISSFLNSNISNMPRWRRCSAECRRNLSSWCMA